MNTDVITMPEPCIYKETSSGTYAMSVRDDMLSRRELSILGQIDQQSAYWLCQQLRYLACVEPSEEITLFVDSPGGSVSAGLAIVDTMQLISAPVRTVCMDTAASMGAVVFACGAKRTMLPNSKLMLHDPLVESIGGSALAVQDASQRLMQTRNTLTNLLMERSGLSLKQMRKLMGKDTYLSASEALEMGFADEIATAL